MLAQMRSQTDRLTKRVLIAEDSATIRYHLRAMIEAEPNMTVIAEARDGEEAIRLTAEWRPDVISMDINMPHLDGLEATRRIMANTPTPVVVVSSLLEHDVQLSVRALEAGALAVVEKPPSRQHPDFEVKQGQLVKTLMAMAGIPVVRRGGAPFFPRAITGTARHVYQTELVAIGASAGGPSALSKLLGAFPADFPVPVVVVQHMPPEFVPGLARWLDRVTPLEVKVAEANTVLRSGVVHLAPGDKHLRVARVDGQLHFDLQAEQGNYLHQPSVDVFLQSVAEICGAKALGVILTGMGDDGAEGLLAMFQKGARTLAQDKASSVVYGMPGAAVACGAVQQVLSIADMPSAIMRLL